MERRRIEWPVVVATFAAAGLVLGFVESHRIVNRVPGQPVAASSATLSAFTQVNFSSRVTSFAFYGRDYVVATLENGNLECRSLSGDLLWRVRDAQATDIRFTRDGKRVMAWNADDGMRVFFPESGTQNAAFKTTAPIAWSANDRYFVAKENDKPVLCDVITGKTRPCAGADEDKTAVSNTGDVYYLADNYLCMEALDQAIHWKGLARPSDKTRLDWSYTEESHFGPSYVIDIRADFSDVTTLRLSPNGNTLALGKDDGTIELVRVPTMLAGTGRIFPSSFAPKAAVRTVSSPVPFTWMEWLQEGALAVAYGNENREDYSLVDTNGNVLARQADKKDPWITAKGTMTLETRNGTITARRFLGAQSGEEWVLNTPTVDTEVSTNVYGENLAAVSNGQTVSFYEIPAP